MWSLNASQQLHLVLTQRNSFPLNTEEKTCYVRLIERWYIGFQVDVVDLHHSWILHL